MGKTLRWFSRFPRALPLAIFLTIFAMTLMGVWAIENAESDARRADLEEHHRVLKRVDGQYLGRTIQWVESA